MFDRLDIRVFTQALRSYSAHCLFARENGTAPEGLSNDISLGFVFGAGYGCERESEAVYAINIAPVSQFHQTPPSLREIRVRIRRRALAAAQHDGK